MDQYQLGIDIGATGIKGGLVNLATGALQSEKIKLATPSPARKEDVVIVVNKLIKLLNWNGEVGCGFPSIVQNGICKSASNIPKEWIGTDLNKFFTKHTGLPFTFANDADLAGLAEMEFGTIKKRHQGTTIMVTLGTGIGSAIFYNGELVPNSELGALYYKKSIFEHYASNNARKVNDWSFNKWGKYLNEFVNHVDRLFSPDLLIIGGGVSKRFDEYKHTLETDVRIEQASLLNNAGLVGAAVLAHRNIHIS